MIEIIIVAVILSLLLVVLFAAVWMRDDEACKPAQRCETCAHMTRQGREKPCIECVETYPILKDWEPSY